MYYPLILSTYTFHLPGQSKKKDGKSSQKKTKVKKEERDFDLEDSELGMGNFIFH